MNELKFSDREVSDMIVKYFMDCENKAVTVSYTRGKVVRKEKYLPPMHVVHFSASEKVLNEKGVLIDNPIPLVDGYFEKALSTVLAAAGFEVDKDGISFDANGIVVRGMKKDLGEKQL